MLFVAVGLPSMVFVCRFDELKGSDQEIMLNGSIMTVKIKMQNLERLEKKQLKLKA